VVRVTDSLQLYSRFCRPEPLLFLSSSSSVLWAGHVARVEKTGNAYRLLVGKPKGRRPLGRPRRRWFDNIRMNLVEVGWSDVNCIGLTEDSDRWRALVNSVLNLRIP
jgi:hypothetical protein